MGFFEHYFNIEDSGDEHAVCCPFPHHTNTGLEYYETNPSAHVNTKDRLFHCKVCNEGHSEVSLLRLYYNVHLQMLLEFQKHLITMKLMKSGNTAVK